jgi:hypothetical protein
MRHLKQLIYGVFYLALWAAVIGGIYAWQRPAPSCFDGRQNQNETGVDCGGACAQVCIPVAILPLEVVGSPRMVLFGNASTTASTTPRASLVAEIRNSNLDFGAGNFEYVFSVHDQVGGTIASFPGNSFVYPGEIKYLALLNAALPAGSAPAYARLVLQSPQWTPAARFPRPLLSIQAATTEVANDNVITRGTLVNQDSINFPAVYLTALFYSSRGEIVGVSGTERNNVTAGESREFALFHPLIADAALDRTRVFVTAFNPR